MRRVAGRAWTIALLTLLPAGSLVAQASDPAIPRLRRQGTATQLVVDGKPFLIRGGELGNSTASSVAGMRPIWPKLRAMHLDAVIAPVYWELIEPEEGRYDFASVDSLIADARANGMRLVLLWFGSWKNSMSSYARAFGALMRHLRAVDGTRHTVLMMQVENEIGMIPTARDHSALADSLWAQPVPSELLAHFPNRPSGTWEEVFGATPQAEELFTAWYFARYVQHVVAAGKAAYPLPMYANAALARPGRLPGQYPSGGPLPHLVDVWRAGAPSLDFLAPDIYFPNFTEWADRYVRAGNPLFIPEAALGGQSAINALYAYGARDAIGFSAFAIESADPAVTPLTQSYALVEQLAPMILANQGRGTMVGVMPPTAFDGTVDTTSQTIRLGDYTLTVSFQSTRPPAGYTPPGPGAPIVFGFPAGPAARLHGGGGVIVALAPDEFLVAGSGITVTFAPAGPGAPIAGILRAQEGRYENGRWVGGRWLNGDQTNQGRHIRLGAEEFSMQRVKLYRYR